MRQLSENLKVNKLQAVVDFVWNNQYCSLYTDFWKEHGITSRPILRSVEDFKKTIPPISRNDLLTRKNPNDRLFIDAHSEPIALASTSGSTTGDPLFYWRHARFDPHLIRIAHTGSKGMISIYDYNKVLSQFIGLNMGGTSMLNVDVHRIEDAIAFVKTLQFDVLWATPTALLLLGDAFKEHEALLFIKGISLYGEPFSVSMMHELQERYPNAKIFSDFTLSEMNCTAGFFTSNCSEQGTFHVYEESVFAIIKNEKLLLTNLEVPSCMPLIQYDAGDRAEWVTAKECSCGDSSPRFRLLGRANMDYVRIEGLELRVDLIEKVLQQYTEHLLPVVRAQVFRGTDTKPARLVVGVMKRENSMILESYLEALLETAIRDEFQVSQNMYFKDAMRAGKFMEPEITFIDQTEKNNKNKSIKIVD